MGSGEIRALVGTVVTAVLLLVVPTAFGKPVSGARETVDFTMTSTKPNSPTGFIWSAKFRNPNNPNATPPSVRRFIITAPGVRTDTSVPATCRATDDSLKRRGDSACPARSKIGHGQATLSFLGLVRPTFPTSTFNRHPNEQIELLRSGRGGVAAVHGFFRGDDFDTPIPTCLNGGSPPRGCPFDEVALVANQFNIPEYTIGGRTYSRTPPTCPSSGYWTFPLTFFYGDGATERILTKHPCTRPTTAARPRTRLKVRPRRVRAGSRERFRFKAKVRREGRWAPLARARIRFAGRTRRTNRRGRASMIVRFRRPGRHRAQLAKRGVRGSSARVRVLPR